MVTVHRIRCNDISQPNVDDWASFQFQTYYYSDRFNIGWEQLSLRPEDERKGEKKKEKKEGSMADR
jgi:hypothetical protein